MINSNKKEVDKIDIQILKILTEDGKKSNRKIAETLERSPVTINKRIDGLLKKGIIKKYNVDIDYEKLGYEIIALIEITISKGMMIEVEQGIAQHPNVFAVYDLTGQYDAIILARFKTRTKLSELVKKINSYEYVIRTNTHLILNTIKEGMDFSKLIDYEKEKKSE